VSEQGEHNARLFLSRVRDNYVDQLLLFIADQRRNSIRGESEVKIELEPGSPVFRSLACADFVRNDGEPEIVGAMLVATFWDGLPADGLPPEGACPPESPPPPPEQPEKSEMPKTSKAQLSPRDWRRTRAKGSKHRCITGNPAS